jgi:dihydroxy-acid dehydratase
VASSWGEINPAAVHLNRVVEAVKAGIWSAGGTPREFVISSICTSMAGHDNYHLPHRDLVAGYIETVAQTNLLDAMVFVPVCDDVVPGHLMAAARLNLPSVFVTGGYMLLNRYRGEPLDPLDVAPRHYARYLAGEIGEEEFRRVLDRGCSGIGACPVMGTANTMAAMTEALGMSLPRNATLPGADSALMRLAFRAGETVVGLLKMGLRPSDIMTLEAFENAIRVLMALGGSTNAVLHLQAIAAELDLQIPATTFNRLSAETPFLCDVAPSGPSRHFISDLDEAGGLPAVMKELEPLLAGSCLTVTGKTVGENLGKVRPGDRRVIHSREAPLSPDGGLIFLGGNLAPGGALIKKSAVPPAMLHHQGPARIFDTEEEACDALHRDELEAGDVVVVRYRGPRGDPGMRLLQRFLWLLEAKGLHDRIAFLTDGRISGTNKGCAVVHLAPEAAVGGPIALVREGDRIEIDVVRQRLTLLVPDEELAERKRNWVAPSRVIRKGYLAIYARNAKSAENGAGLDYGGE